MIQWDRQILLILIYTIEGERCVFVCVCAYTNARKQAHIQTYTYMHVHVCVYYMHMCLQLVLETGGRTISFSPIGCPLKHCSAETHLPNQLL